MRALQGALDIWQDVDLTALRQKGVALADLFIELVDMQCGHFGLKLESPRDGARRGSQVSFAHANAYQIMQALGARGVIGDFRAPATMRFGFAPLYVGYSDIWRAVALLQEVLRTEAWNDERFQGRKEVT